MFKLLGSLFIILTIFNNQTEAYSNEYNDNSNENSDSLDSLLDLQQQQKRNTFENDQNSAIKERSVTRLTIGIITQRSERR